MLNISNFLVFSIQRYQKIGYGLVLYDIPIDKKIEYVQIRNENDSEWKTTLQYQQTIKHHLTIKDLPLTKMDIRCITTTQDDGSNEPVYSSYRLNCFEVVGMLLY